MENSKLPFMYWYVAMHLLTNTKKSFSAAELQRQLGHKRYQPIWEMVCKLRDVMGKRDNLYQLTDEVELDEAIKVSIKNGAAGICIFTPDRMTNDHWKVFTNAIYKSIEK